MFHRIYTVLFARKPPNIRRIYTVSANPNDNLSLGSRNLMARIPKAQMGTSEVETDVKKRVYARFFNKLEHGCSNVPGNPFFLIPF